MLWDGETSINGLSPTLRARLKEAMAAAKADGITLTITSGRRTAPQHFEALTTPGSKCPPRAPHAVAKTN